MRTTVTLDDDVAAQLRSLAPERGVSFKEALNSALRPGINLDKALQLAGELEDTETVRKLELRK